MFKKFFCILVSTTMLLQTLPVSAGPHGGGGPRPGPAPAPHHNPGPDHGPSHYYHGPGPYPWGRGVCIARLPGAYVSLAVAGAEFFYCAGLYYRYSTAGYVVIEPPLGAVIPVLPDGYTVVYVNGLPYYYYASTYYTVAPSGGYVVVSPAVETTTTVVTTPATTVVTTPATTTTTVPAATQQTTSTPVATPAATTTAPAATTTESDTFDVQIPNGNGSFTLVRLIRTKDGFLGPQGEFYPDHPTIEQLKARYVK